MNDLSPSPTIHDIKVDMPGASRAVGWSQFIRLEWMDSAGARRLIELHGRTAQLVSADLHAATLMGEMPRRTYLIGLIRGLDRGERATPEPPPPDHDNIRGR